MLYNYPWANSHTQKMKMQVLKSVRDVAILSSSCNFNAASASADEGMMHCAPFYCCDFSLMLQKLVEQQQQRRVPNGSYRERGDTRRGRGRTEGPGRGNRGGRGGRGGPPMQYGPALDAATSNPTTAANRRSEDFGHNPVRPQRMINEDGPQGSGRGAPYGRGNARGGGSHRGRGGRTNNAQKAQAVKPFAEASKPGKLIAVNA